jgi:hypothetical protein
LSPGPPSGVGTNHEGRLDRLLPPDVDGHRLPILGQAGDLLAPADLDAQFGGTVGEHLLDAMLRHHQRVDWPVWQVVLVEPERGEHVTRHRCGRSAGAGEALEQAAPVQHGHDPADHAVRAIFSDFPGGALLQHEWPRAGQGKLTGEHQTVRAAAADDDDIDHSEILFLGYGRAFPCTGNREPAQ